MRYMRSNADVLSGLFFIAVGGLAIGIGTTYRVGTPGEMGPGFFPIALGAVLSLLGLVVALLGVRKDADGFPSIRLRPIVVVLGAVLAFGLFVERLGLVVVIGLMVALCSVAGWRTGAREQLVLFLCLAAVVPGLFVIGLGLPMPLWPQW